MILIQGRRLDLSLELSSLLAGMSAFPQVRATYLALND